MDNTYKIMLYETYKSMLTRNKQNVFEQYYYLDLSLREIGENNKTTFQAVRDNLRKTEKELQELEQKLGMLKLKNEVNELKEYVSSSNMNVEKLKEKINKIGDN